MWRHALFDTAYRIGRPIWDVAPPQEIQDAVEGPNAMPSGHALDVGCGTGNNVVYLAQHGWQATGVDFSAAAIRKARDNTGGLAGTRFIEGDVTKLSQLEIPQPIDLVIDMGTYHSLPDSGKPRYVAELASILEPGTPMMMWQGICLKPGEIPDAFGKDFIVERIEAKDFTIRRKFLRHTITAHWYWLRRP